MPFYQRDRGSLIFPTNEQSRRRRFVPIVPDLVVEGIPPSDRVSDVNDKVDACIEAAVRVIWAIEPIRHRVSAYSADRSARLFIEGDVNDVGDVLPGFTLPLADIFR